MSVEQALAFHRQGRLSEAASLYQAMLKADRERFDALHGLGTVRSQQGRHEEARTLFRRALRQNPKSPEAEYNLALALASLRRYDEAVLHYQRALALRPGFFQAHNNLGNIFKSLDRRAEAMDQYRQALEINPDFAVGHNNLGNSLQALERRDEAEMHYRRAIAVEPRYSEAYNNLGNILHIQGRTEEAITCYRQALSLDRNYVEALYNLGNVLKELGQFGDAAAALRRAIALDPTNTGAYLSLVDTQKLKPGDADFEAMERLVTDKRALDDSKRLTLHFALAGLYDDLGRYDEAFAHMVPGNALKRREIVYDETAMNDYFSRVKQVFTPEFVAALAGSGDPSARPLFILGMPRSGTTLVEQILATHPKIFGAGELDEFSQLAKELSFPDGLVALTPERLRKLGADYVQRIEARGNGAVWITDKMPSNFFYVGLIHLALPNARIIHTRRNAADTCLSCYSKLFVSRGQNFSYDMGELGRYWRQYDALMSHWRQVLPKGAMLELRYADLVADIETEARRLLAWCGVDWDDACLAFHRNKRPVLTASVAQVRQPIYQSSVGRWRAYERHLTPLIRELTPAQLAE
jgi:tetratricopeptide (TPR) repeat protein